MTGILRFGAFNSVFYDERQVQCAMLCTIPYCIKWIFMKYPVIWMVLAPSYNITSPITVLIGTRDKRFIIKHSFESLLTYIRCTSVESFL